MTNTITCPHGHAYGTCLMCYHDLVGEQQSEIERLQKREAQFAAALYAVKEVVAKDSPQWLLADQLARMMLSAPPDEPSEPHKAWCASRNPDPCNCRDSVQCGGCDSGLPLSGFEHLGQNGEPVGVCERVRAQSKSSAYRTTVFTSKGNLLCFPCDHCGWGVAQHEAGTLACPSKQYAERTNEQS